MTSPRFVAEFRFFRKAKEGFVSVSIPTAVTLTQIVFELRISRRRNSNFFSCLVDLLTETFLVGDPDGMGKMDEG